MSKDTKELAVDATLRDWFAGMALQGIWSIDDTHDLSYEEMAKQAYASADAMLAERSK